MPIFGGAPAGSGLNYLASSGLLNTGTNPLAGLGSMIQKSPISQFGFNRNQPRADYSGYLSGTDTKPLNSREVSDLYSKVANGSLQISPDQFNRLLQPNSDTKGIDTSEFYAFSPEWG